MLPPSACGADGDCQPHPPVHSERAGRAIAPWREIQSQDHPREETFMFRTALVVAVATLALTQAAAAQTPAPAAAAAAAPVPDQDLKAYAKALLEIEKLRTTPGGLTQPAMVEAVQKA